jgi:hypothetical protein
LLNACIIHLFFNLLLSHLLFLLFDVLGVEDIGEPAEALFEGLNSGLFKLGSRLH